jgi:CheY-like chemotaxis protein
MTEAETMVFVPDDEAALREALQSLLRSVGLRVTTFAQRGSSSLANARKRPSLMATAKANERRSSWVARRPLTRIMSAPALA